MLPGTDKPQFDTRVWLQTEFSTRKRKNARYSLRAFAKFLEMEASSVSQLMSGKRRASTKVLTALCDRLSPRPEVRQALLAQLATAPAAPAEVDYRLLAADAFALMADWYHYAILDLPFAQGFRGDVAWIADKLGLPLLDTRLAVERLVRLGLFRWEDDTLVKTQKLLTNYIEGDTSEAHRELQRQILQQALDAIDRTAPREKDITAMTMAINPAQVPEAKRRIKKFRRSLCELLETGERTQMYQLAVQLFPISKRTDLP